jgi:hypothetical protein
MSEILTLLGRWENVAFLVPATVGVLFMLLQFVGLGLDQVGGDHDADADADLDHDLDHGVDADIDHDVEVEADHDIDVDHDHDLDTAVGHAHDHHTVEPGGPGVLTAILVWFNVGRAPFMVILETLFLAFGVFGVFGTTVLAREEGMTGWPAVGLAAAFSTVAAALSAKLVSGAFARWLPTFETKRVTTRSLVGAVAEVASAEIDGQGGRAAARDGRGDLYTVFCRTAPGASAAKRGERVKLVGYDVASDRYIVKPMASEACSNQEKT